MYILWKLIFLGVFCMWFFFLTPPMVQAREWIDISHVRQLRTILKIDSADIITHTMRVRRNMIFSSIVRDISTLHRTWNLTPTYDATLRYTPYLQKYALSCEIAAFVTILRSMSVEITEDDVIRDLPVFSWPYSDGIWWDPEHEFVGSITGSQMARTGYGVYAQPLSQLLPDGIWYRIYHTVSTESGSIESSKAQMAYYLDAIEKWDHVILWGDWCTTPSEEDGLIRTKKSRLLSLFPIAGKNPCDRTSADRKIFWKTPDGREISALSGEHAFILLGYIGPRIRPSHIIVWDTDTGRHIYTTQEWIRKWSLLDYRALQILPGE